MATLENLKPGAKVTGIIPNQHVTVVDVKWHGSTAVELFYKRADGQPGTQLLYRHDEANLEVIATKRAWDFNADGDLFRLVAEAYRIHLAHLFDPVLAVHTSLIMPLPHQITGVYGEMLTRQPLRFLLADDPGAGKTIMWSPAAPKMSYGKNYAVAGPLRMQSSSYLTVYQNGARSFCFRKRRKLFRCSLSISDQCAISVVWLTIGYFLLYHLYTYIPASLLFILPTVFPSTLI